MAEECARSKKSCGEMVIGMHGSSTSEASSFMATFIQNNDLVCHMLKFMTQKEERRNTSLVCKSWNHMSESFGTWRTPFFRVLPCEEERLEIKINGGIWGKGDVWTASVSALKNIFLQRRHVTQFEFGCEYQRRKPFWKELASIMQHIRWLSLTIDVVSTHITEARPFLLENLPNLTYLRMSDNEMGFGAQKWWLSSITLRLPALENFDWSPEIIEIEALKAINFECPNLKNLDMYMWSGMVVTPSIYSQLEYLRIIALGVPANLLRNVGKEMVLNTCPLLTALTLSLDDEVDDMATMTLDLPCLEILKLDNASADCKFTCPNLTDVTLYNCLNTVLPQTMMAQLKRFSGHGCQLLNNPNTGDEGAFTLQCPSLEYLCLTGLDGAVSMTLDCARLKTLTLTTLGRNQSFILVSSPISELSVLDCPHFDVSPMILPTLETIHLLNTIVDERRVWSLPKLTQLDLSKLRALPLTVESDVEVEIERSDRQSFRIKDLAFLQHLSLDWKESYDGYNRGVRRVGFLLSISQGTTLRLHGKCSLMEMRIVAPHATELSMEGCEFLRELDIDCPLLLNMVTRRCRKVVGEAQRRDDFVVKCDSRKHIS